MSVAEYIKELDRELCSGIATEHTYRPALKTLLKDLLKDLLDEVAVTNEPKQIACGAPDLVLTCKGIPLGYVEAKDIGKNLDDPAHEQQLKRYTESLDNLIFTNYLEFRLIRDGAQVSAVNIGTVVGKRVKPGTKDAAESFIPLLESFAGYQGQTITTADDLAKRMALKTRMLAVVITEALSLDENATSTTREVSELGSALQGQLGAFKQHLIHDLEPDDFADIYAQTVAYGLFAARLHDSGLQTFSRQRAAELIPSSNPFLRRFFQGIVGFDLDERISWIADDLADLFRAADVGELMKDYGRATQRNDPFLNFYETFLGEYDQNLRKSRGVYYTPEPVVNFIVRAVDEILRTDFDLPKGLADTSKTTIEVDAPPTAGKHKKEVHKVQILDPAAGTGTFLAAIVQEIYARQFSNQQGAWPDYVKTDLIPRLNGFEVMMAPYAMAHTKLEMVLRDSGGELDKNRLRIFLTNSLEEHSIDAGDLFAQWLSTEANEANFIKRDMPVMVVIGNPPYSGESANKGEWITNLMQTYKREPGGGKLRERNSKWLNDDYVKFIRYGQYFIDRIDKGVLAYINNHSFLDNPTFRGMRWSLLQSFDKIYILDLHGNSKKNETAPDGSMDNNVFDIQQGVSINLFIKTGERKKNVPGKVFHYDLYGQRQSKYQFLWDNDLARVGFKELKPAAPQYFFVAKNYALQVEYDKGFPINELFPTNSVGIVTARDKFTIHHTPQELKTAIARLRAMDDETAREEFSLGKDVRDWKVALARKDLEKNVFGKGNDTVVPIHYRPFDIRHTYYTGNSKGFHCRPRGDVMRHFIQGENVGLITSRITKDVFSVLCTKHITAHKSATRYDISYIFPLYLYPDDKQRTLDDKQTRKPSLDASIVKTIANGLGLRFTPEKENDPKTFAPIDLLDYIYATLHSPAYRQRYKEFLKIDFPRIPYPADKKTFHKLAKLGGELRALHLLESPALDSLITGYPKSGDNIVTKPTFEITDAKKRLGKVKINKTQYFQDVPEIAWNFYIGGYQPAQKWLKDRKGRALSYQDITHYQKIIVALTETDRLMRKIDTVLPLPTAEGSDKETLADALLAMPQDDEEFDRLPLRPRPIEF